MVLSKKERALIFKDIDETISKLQAIKAAIMDDTMKKNRYKARDPHGDGTKMSDLFIDCTKDHIASRIICILKYTGYYNKTVWEFVDKVNRDQFLEHRNVGKNSVEYLSNLLRLKMQLIW